MRPQLGDTGTGPSYRWVWGALDDWLSRSWLGRLPAALFERQCRQQGFLQRARYVVRLRSLAPANRTPPVRVAFLTDLHLGRTVPLWFIERAIGAAMEWQPDLILLGGDTILFEERPSAGAERVLRALQAPLGAYAVHGNHDLWLRDGGPDAMYRAAGITVLKNQGLVIETAAGPIWLCGVDDEWGGSPDPHAALRDRPEGMPSLMVAHNPVTALRFPPDGPDLCLSGHTHGGQWCYPSGAAIWIPERRKLNHASGWKRVGYTWVYVSRGLGGGTLPFRINCRPEVTLLTLTGGCASQHPAASRARPPA